MTTPFAWSPDRRIHGRLSRWPTYQLFGVSLASDFPFKAQLGPTTSPADLSFTLVREAPFENYDRDDPIYVSRILTDKGDRAASLYRLKGCLVFDITEVGAFYLFPHQIVFHLRNPDREHMVETYLLGTVFSLWLESRGIAVLHASAIVLEQGAVGFLAASGGGKSSLTASFLRRGRPVSDHRKTYFFGLSPTGHRSRQPRLWRGIGGNGSVQRLNRPQIEHRQRVGERRGAGELIVPPP